MAENKKKSLITGRDAGKKAVSTHKTPLATSPETSSVDPKLRKLPSMYNLKLRSGPRLKAKNLR